MSCASIKYPAISGHDRFHSIRCSETVHELAILLHCSVCTCGPPHFCWNLHRNAQCALQMKVKLRNARFVQCGVLKIMIRLNSHICSAHLAVWSFNTRSVVTKQERRVSYRGSPRDYTRAAQQKYSTRPCNNDWSFSTSTMAILIFRVFLTLPA